MNLFTLFAGLVGYIAFEMLEARARALAVGSKKTVQAELWDLRSALIFFGLLSMCFAGFVVEGPSINLEYLFDFSVDRLVRGGSAGFAFIPVLTKLRLTLPEQRLEEIRPEARRVRLSDILKEYLRQRT